MATTKTPSNQPPETSKPTSRCVVLGTVVSDTKIRVPHEELVPGATVICDDPQWSLGGNAGRCAATLSALGAEVSLLADIGSDAPGQRIINELRSLGVDVQAVVTHDDHPTSSTTSLVGTDGERTLIHSFGANACLDITVLDRLKATLKPGDILAVCGARLLPSLPLAAVGKLFDFARQVGATSVYDTTKRPASSPPQDLQPILSTVDVFCTSMGEAQEDWDMTDAYSVARHLQNHCRGSVVVKDGKAGAWFAADASPVARCRAPQVDTIDTTGAGDNFMAGLLYGLACGMTLGDAVRSGTAVGALSVSQSGDVCHALSVERLHNMAGSVTREATD